MLEHANRRFEVQIVQFGDLECRPSNSTIWSADRQIQRFVLHADRRMRQFDVQPVKFKELECRPSISSTSVSCDGRCPSLRQRQAPSEFLAPFQRTSPVAAAATAAAVAAAAAPFPAIPANDDAPRPRAAIAALAALIAPAAHEGVAPP